MSQWIVKWDPGAPLRYSVTEPTSAAILHSIDGLDPHNPVFLANRCYTWTLWSAMQFRRVEYADGDASVLVDIQTPLVGGHSGKTRSLRKLMFYHCHGREVDAPITSSKKPCPCGSGSAYGACCFGAVNTVCEKFTGVRSCGLCVNPLHMEGGPRRAHEEDMRMPHCVIMVGPTAPCGRCRWNANEFAVTDNIRGVHPGPSAMTVVDKANVDEVIAQFRQWKFEGARATLEALRADPARNHAEIRHIEGYLVRQKI